MELEFLLFLLSLYFRVTDRSIMNCFFRSTSISSPNFLYDKHLIKHFLNQLTVCEACVSQHTYGSQRTTVGSEVTLTESGLTAFCWAILLAHNMF